MKKRIIALCMIAILIVSCSACKKTENNQEVAPTQEATAQVPTTAPTAAPTAEPTAEPTVAPDENESASDETVTVNMSKLMSDFVDSQEAVDEMVATEGFISGTYSEDGVTLVMTKQKNEEYVAKTKEEIDKALDEIVNDETMMSYITKIDVNDSYNEYTVTTTESELSFMDYMIAYTLQLYGEILNTLQGRGDQNAHVFFKDSVSGDIVYESDSVQSAMDAVEALAEAFSDFGEGDDIVFEEVDYPETVFVDNDVFKFTVKSIEANGEWGYTINAEVTNKTDKTINISNDDTSANGWNVSMWWGADLEAGETQEAELSFSNSDLARCGITDITGIEMTLIANDAEDWFAEGPLCKETIYIYPRGEENYSVEKPETLVADVYTVTTTEDFGIYVMNMSKDELWGSYMIDIYIDNYSDRSLSFDMDDVTANGWMCNTSVYENVPAGKMCMTYMTVSENIMNQLGGEEPSIIEFFLSVNDAHDLSSDYLVSDFFSIYPHGYDLYTLEPGIQNTDRELDSDDIILGGNDDYSLIIDSAERDEWGDCEISFIITNKTDKKIQFELKDSRIVINGKELEYTIYPTLLPGKSTCESIYVSQLWLEENEIEGGIIETIELTLDELSEDYETLSSLTYKADFNEQ